MIKHEQVKRGGVNEARSSEGERRGVEESCKGA